MARTRKTIAAVAAGAAGVLGMAGVAAAAHGHGPAHAVTVPGGRHDGRGHDDVSTTTVTTGPDDTSTTGPDETTSGPEHVRPEPGDDNGVDAAGDDASDDNGVDAVGHDANDDTTTSMPDDTSTTMPDDTTSTSTPDDKPTTDPVASIPDGPQTFTVSGGTVTVDIESGVLSLQSITPADGFDVKDQRSESDRIEVEFRSGDTHSRVRVRIQDGRLRVETRDQ